MIFNMFCSGALYMFSLFSWLAGSLTKVETKSLGLQSISLPRQRLMVSSCHLLYQNPQLPTNIEIYIAQDHAQICNNTNNETTKLAMKLINSENE